MLEIVLIKALIPFLISDYRLAPGSLVQEEYYPSGVKDCDKYYSWDKPSKKYPLLTLDTTVYDPEYNKIEAGMYSVEYSPEFNVLLIGSGRDLIKAPVIQVLSLKQKVHIPSVKVFAVKDKKVFILYKNENLEVQSFLYLPEAILDGN